MKGLNFSALCLSVVALITSACGSSTNETALKGITSFSTNAQSSSVVQRAIQRQMERVRQDALNRATVNQIYMKHFGASYVEHTPDFLRYAPNYAVQSVSCGTPTDVSVTDGTDSITCEVCGTSNSDGFEIGCSGGSGTTFDTTCGGDTIALSNVDFYLQFNYDESTTLFTLVYDAEMSVSINGEDAIAVDCLFGIELNLTDASSQDLTCNSDTFTYSCTVGGETVECSDFSDAFSSDLCSS